MRMDCGLTAELANRDQGIGTGGIGAMAQLTSNGIPLDMAPDAFGELRESNDLLNDMSALRERMAEDGYLLIRDYLDLEWVMDARRSVLEVLAEHEMIDENHSLMEARAARSDNGKFRSAIGSHAALGKLPAVRKLVHSGRMIDFYAAFLGGEVRSFDFVWMRVMGPGRSSAPHYDIVYMGRGTTNLYTSWTPLGDAPLSDAALMVLENSHRLEQVKTTYGQMDVDKKSNWKKTGGSYGKDPAAIQKELGCRWLTTDFRAGDLLVFSMYTMHCSLDNRSDRIRLSSDTRYQLASEPVDERWIGENPIAHSVREEE
ncbi:hypothetical protein GBAR_LOCUS20028 [Geodia barretti]|uniref:Phytanoyl-CoA dioxygenase n=1 Tax=Geodia barretti TaxID=519541 RepID=A0AA35X0T4_GEOBA|nr:hypothetical protein GBAR_LOCUS20028 [Geodia barretti]